MNFRDSMRIRISPEMKLLVGLVVASFFVLAAAANPQTASQSEPTNLIYSVKGPDLYQAYCASCHGADGRGGGAVAPALKAKVPDLTVLAKNNKGVYPVAKVRRVIAGDESGLPAHGTRAMPVWGPIFHQIERDQDFGNVRLQNLAMYLESMQRK